MRRRVGSCTECDKLRLLAPVPIFPGFAGRGCIMWCEMCLDCRLNVRSDRWISLVEEFLHSPRKEARECAKQALEWSARKEAE